MKNGYLILLLIMTLCGAVASLFLKKASKSTSFKRMLLDYNIYVGAGIYLLASIINIYVLKKLDFSIVLPLTSFTYIWTILIAYLCLKEKITLKKCIGVCLILIGAIVIAL